MNALHLPLLATGKLTFLPRHDSPWVEDVKYDKGDQHRKGVQAVLESFMDGHATLEPLGVFDETEDDPHLCNI